MKVKTYNFKISIKEVLNIDLTEELMVNMLSSYLTNYDRNPIDVKQTKRPKKEEL